MRDPYVQVFRKYLISISTIFIFQSCYHYHVLRDYKSAGNAVPGNTKIALVGFYPYKFNTIRAGSHSMVLVTDLDEKSPTSKYFTQGQSLGDFPVKGIDSTVPPNRVKEFVDTYRSYVGMYGDVELRKLVQWTGEPEKETYLFKKRDVDFYVLGIHGPENETNNYGNSFRAIVSYPFSVLTLGMIPVWSTRDIHSTFFVYDKQLQLLGKKEFKYKATVFGAWWGRKEEGQFDSELPQNYRNSIYKADVEEFADFFPSFSPQIKK